MRCIPIEIRFWKKVNKNGPNGCWLWTGGKAYGYGNLHPGGSIKSTVRAHRFSYEIHKGIIPNGLEVCHHCDNPSCVNPEHLFIGTSLDNARDRNNKKRHWVPKGNESPHSKLTENIIRKIRSEYQGGWGQMTFLGKKYGVSQQQISRIINKKEWSHI